MPHHERTQPVYTPPGGPPQGNPPSRELYDAMGEEAIFRMLEALYLELEKSEVRSLFPPDMRAASAKSAAFFVQIMGGPPLFSERFGPPRMRMRHVPFEIDEAARQTWLRCFGDVLDNAEEKFGFPAEHLPGFRAFLETFSSWMVNVAPR